MVTLLRKQKKGLTLIEVLVAVFILSVAVASTLFFFSHAIASTAFARELTVATSHAEHVLEEMQTRRTLADITATDWSKWAKEEASTLPAEILRVVFQNSTRNPLDIQVTVHWTVRNKTNQVSLSTKIAR